MFGNAQAPVLDANQMVGFTSFTLDGQPNQQFSGQSFVAQNTGIVDHIDLGIQALGNPANFQIGIIAGSNPNNFSFMGAVLVNSGTWIVGMNTINLVSANISVTAGQPYSIGIIYNDMPNPANGAAFYNNTDSYAQGVQWVDVGGGTLNPDPLHDLNFAVYVTPGMPGPTVNTTQPTSNLLLSNWLYCSGVSGAQDWKWRFIDQSNGNTYYRVKGNIQPNMPLSWVNGLQYGHTYSVSVQAKVNNVWGPYGTGANVSLAANAPTTNLTTSGAVVSCGATGLTSSSRIYAKAVTGASSYKFRIQGGTYDVTKTSNVNNILLVAWANTGLNAGTYTVSVTEYSGGTWSATGMPCSIQISSNVRMMETADENMDRGIEVGFGVAAYPNPVQKGSSMNVNISGANEQTATIRVVDLTGREVSNTQVGIDADEFTTSIAIGDEYSSGIYFLQVVVNGEITTTKFVVE